MREYVMQGVLSDSLVKINGGMWRRVKVRKPHRCGVCGMAIAQRERAYAPLVEHNELRPRYVRICEGCVDRGKQQVEQAYL